jgi:hypothetical protein
VAHSQAQAEARAQAELQAELEANKLESVASTLYDDAFSGPSLGTEEELSGTTIKMKMTAPRLIGIVFKEGTPLVLITRDMRLRALEGDYREYTVELRTTPTLVPGPNTPGELWEYRRRALQVAIWAIENRTTGPLQDDEWRDYTTYIRNSDHSFIHSSSTITGSDKQATFGIPASAIVSAGQDDRAAGRLHPHVQVPWYRDQFIADTAVDGFDLDEKVAYAFLMSAVLKLTQLPRDKKKDEPLLYQPQIKNEWQVRPRTPPLKILDIFTEVRRDAIKQAVVKSTRPDVTPPAGTDWSKFAGWITDGENMGGHKPPDATINGTRAMLFEYRAAPVDKYPDAFWQYGEWTTDGF